MSTAASEIARAYAEHDQRIALGRIRVGCILAMILLPMGTIVDLFHYDQQVRTFLPIRLAGAAVMLPLMQFVQTAPGRKLYRELAVVLALIPAASMAWIISLVRQGDAPASSPYYAGLNLVLLAVGLVLQWDWKQSVAAVLGVLALYFAATWRSVPGHVGMFTNNLWFLLLTGVIVVIGNHVQSRLRFREFESRFQLEQSQRELEVSNKRLRELDELKGRFFANISHELRTPLTVVLGNLEALREHPAFTDPALRERLESMHSNGMRLLKLINDLLDLVRLDAGQLKLHPVPLDPHGFLQGLLNSVRRFAEDRGLRLHCEIKPDLTHIHADPDKLEKVFLNLLFNSIKFTPAGGSVCIRAGRDDGMARFEVIDTGAGIAPEHLPFLFSRFWQADTSAQRKFQGAGIGLALVKELVHAHGGTVHAESKVGKGTTMIVRLPLGPPKGQVVSEPAPTPAPPVTTGAPDAPGGDGKDPWISALYRRAELHASITPLRETLRPWAPPEGGSKPRVLIADDEPDMLRFLRMQLEHDYQIVEAVDGEQAVALAKQILPDVILCDMMMPEKDGLQVCRELRDTHTTRAIPVLMLTAR
ncbi:MAG: response regulator, partial [Bryobacteraceae bacterium]|nr:response regulator [Bryobacteraceae bacterium]